MGSPGAVPSGLRRESSAAALQSLPISTYRLRFAPCIRRLATQRGAAGINQRFPSMKTTHRTPVTRVVESSKRRDFCWTLAASAAGYIHVPGAALDEVKFHGFGVVHIAMDNQL